MFVKRKKYLVREVLFHLIYLKFYVKYTINEELEEAFENV